MQDPAAGSPGHWGTMASSEQEENGVRCVCEQDPSLLQVKLLGQGKKGQEIGGMFGGPPTPSPSRCQS